MKVAVLDLATVFAKLFKPTASSSSSPSYSAAPGAPLSKVQPLLTASASPSGAPSLPVRYTVLACAGGSSLTSVAAAARASPGGSGAGAAALKPLASGSCASGSSSPRSAREPGAWAAPASKPLLFVTLPDIGEEGAPDADPREETALPRQVEGPERELYSGRFLSQMLVDISLQSVGSCREFRRPWFENVPDEGQEEMSPETLATCLGISNNDA
ncbi:hypothetical protein E2320_007792 [Naja naja]|nr:hypothetical protein E2320_007792 [Naja naja]